MIVYEINADGTPGGEIEVPDGTSILPINQTWSAPPAAAPGMVCLFDRQARHWLTLPEGSTLPEIVPDYGSTITHLAFRARFTAEEKLAIELASLDDPTATMDVRSKAAQVRAYQKDIDAAEFINLAFPETIAGVQQLETAGLLVAGRAAEILQTPVVLSELPTYMQGM